MSIHINPIKPWAEMSHTPPLKRLTSSSINPKTGTSSLGHVRGYSASASAMLCDHSGPTPAMHTMPVQLRPHALVKPRESSMIPFVMTRLSEVGPAYTWQLSRTPRISPQTNTCLSYPLCPHSCTPGRTSRSVTYCSRSSTLNFGVFSDRLSEKKLTYWYVYPYQSY
jgi:hypothetical protein